MKPEPQMKYGFYDLLRENELYQQAKRKVIIENFVLQYAAAQGITLTPSELEIVIDARINEQSREHNVNIKEKNQPTKD